MMTRFRGHAVTAMLLLSATPLVAQRSARRVVDRAAIAAAGWHRLGDIVAALPPGSSASIDGYNHEIRGSRIGFFETTQARATWLVRLDGQVMPMVVGGTWILDQIPVAITQLDSVVIVEGPTLTDGRAMLLGTIDLHSRRARGAALVADYQHGDETGDPGPYRYTPRTSTNVEKLGPFTSGAAAAGNSVAALDVAARYSSLNVTDTRVKLGPGYQSDVNSSGGSGVATIDALGGRSYIVGGRGRFTGFLPLATTAGDQQARVIATHGGVSGSIMAVGRRWRYAASATELEIGQLGGVPLLLPDTRRRFGDAFLEGDATRHIRAGAGGAVARRTTAAEEREYTSGRGWVTYSIPGASADIALERSAGKLRLSYAARFARIVGDSDRLDVSVTRLTAWRFGDGLWMDQAVADSGEASALELRADLATSPILKARPSWYARAFKLVDVAARPFWGVAAGVVATTAESAAVTGRLRAEVTQLLDDIGPGERSTPGGFVEGALSNRTVGGFHLSLAGRYAPRTHWSGAIEDVPATRRIDFSVNKAMWHDRVRAQLVMRNLLNAAERSHPDGAQWNLRSHLAVTIALPSGANGR